MKTAPEAKADLRREMRKRRDSMTRTVREVRAVRILERLKGLPEYRTARCVLLFASFQSEIPTREIFLDLCRMGSTVVFPRVEGSDLALYSVSETQFDRLVPGAFGVPEPDPGVHSLVPPSSVDLALVPGLAFDIDGNRLGYGKGFFDRLLPQLPLNTPRLGLAFDFQVLRVIPSGDHDEALTGVVTEEGIYRKRTWSLRTGSEEETRALGRKLAGIARDSAGDSRNAIVFALFGDLGTGKTRLAQGMTEALECIEEAVSPTFVLAREYLGPVPLKHLDLYRLNGPPREDDLRYFDEIFQTPGIAVVEWAERCLDLLPLDALEVWLHRLGESERRIEIVSRTEAMGPELARVLEADSDGPSGGDA